jgi:hypothetical protein
MRPPLLLAALLLAGAASSARAQSPIQLSLFTPVQLVPATQAVQGLRLNLIYGTNTAVTGLDIGLVNMTTRGPSMGLQYGVANIVTGQFTGWQAGLVTIMNGSQTGLQTSVINMAEANEGLQWGGFNSSNQMNGLQLGLVNYARRIHGVQIGIVNIIKEGGQFPVFPIVNWGK